MKKTLLFLFLTFTVLSATEPWRIFDIHLLWAAGPNSISYQGRLRESGQPVSGTRSFNFKLFTAPSAGTEVWASGAVPVLVSSGIYSTQIGNDNLKSLNFAANDYYLEISVGGNAFTPRERISAVPYAFNASTATNVMGAGHIRMSGASGNHWILNGNIGVGTSSPSSRLELRGAQQNGLAGLDNASRVCDFEGLEAVYGYLRSLGIRTYKTAVSGNWDYSVMRFASSIQTNTYAIDHWYNNLGWIDFASNPYLNDIVFGSGTAENMRIRNTGAVGIGVVSPSATLHVSSTTSANLLVLSSGVLSGQEVMTVTKTGKVGIGTTAPSGMLDINSNSPSLVFSHSGGINQDNTGVIFFKEDDASGMKIRYDGINGSGNGSLRITSRNSDVDSDIVSIDRDGKVGIGITNPAYRFVVNNGSVNRFAVRDDSYNLYAFAAWQTSWSDRRLKKEIKPMDDMTGLIMKVNPVTYKWKEGLELDDSMHFGVIAQELREIFPTLVYEDNDGHLNVKRDEFQFILIKAIKEQQEEIQRLRTELNSRIKALEDKNHE